MAGYYSSDCEEDIPAHDCNPCGDKEFARVRSAGFVHAEYYDTLKADPENPNVWAAGIADKKIIIVPETNGELAEASEKEGTGYGDNPSTLLGFDYELTFNDPNFITNCDHYSALLKSRKFHVIYRSSSQTYISPVPSTVIPKAPIANDINGEVVWVVKVKFSTTTKEPIPCPFPTPEGVFDTCFIPGE